MAVKYEGISFMEQAPGAGFLKAKLRPNKKVGIKLLGPTFSLFAGLH